MRRRDGQRQIQEVGERKLLVPRQISFVTSCRERLGRVTPCAPFGKLSADRGAHGVTRPTTSRNLFVTVLARAPQQLAHFAGNIACAHQAFADQNGLHATVGQSLDIGARIDAAFRDQERRVTRRK